jgi:hypothetical protein
MTRITIGNTKVSGFVNQVAAGRILVGTGSYQNRDGAKVFKESISVFLDAKFDGTIPEKGEYVTISGDMIVQPRKDKADELNATMNVRFANQLVKTEVPTKAAAAAEEAAPADAGRDI